MEDHIELAKYLKTVSELEAANYTYDTLIQRTEGKIKTLNIPREIKLHGCGTNRVISILSAVFVGIMCACLGAMVGPILEYFVVRIADLDWSNEPWILISAVCFIFGFTKFINIDKKHEKEWQSEKRYYEKECADDALRLKKEAEQTSYLKNLQKQAAPVHKEVKTELKKFYEQDVIFPKYRNFIAITQINEYFESGRCDTLTGPNGAYNLYENELRMNMVVDRLDKIMTSLEDIKKNQYLIYCEIVKTNSFLSGIIQELENISDNTASAAASASVVAYNTEVTNRLMVMG